MHFFCNKSSSSVFPSSPKGNERCGRCQFSESMHDADRRKSLPKKFLSPEIPLKGYTRDITDCLELQSKLGEGGFCTVRLGLIRTSLFVEKHRVAVKELKSADSDDRSYIDSEHQVLKYLSFMSGFSEANIQVMLYWNEPIRNFPRLILEYYNRGNLLEYTKSLKSNDSVPLEFYQDIARAVAFLHYNCVIHHDIKPENVFIDQQLGNTNNFNLRAIVGDLGLSEITHVSECRSGTTTYMAIEKIMGAGGYTSAVDIWSLGLTMRAMKTKNFTLFPELPKNTNHVELKKHLKAGNRPKVPHILDQDKDFWSLILKMIQDNPGDRPTAKQIYTFFTSSSNSNESKCKSKFGYLPNL